MMPLLFNESAPPNKNPSPARFRRRSCHLPSLDTFIAKRSPLSPSLICSTTRLESPQTGAISFHMGIAWAVPGKSPDGDQHSPMHGISDQYPSRNHH
ncbi:hypothetical protein V8C43DRAFT_270393 [Trichoderma afarasin]